MGKKINIVLSGIGNRALPKKPENSNWLGWVELIKRSKNFDLVAAQDVSKDSIKRIVDRGYLCTTQTYRDIDLMLKEVRCDAILISNPAEYHADTIAKAIDYGIHILVEKPFVNDLTTGRRLVELIEKKGNIGAVIQNWRSKDVGRLLRETIQSGLIGRVGYIMFRYIRNRENPNYPPYLFKELYPLLYAMGIHHLDLFKYILRDEYESVSGCSFKPPWSLYESDTGLSLFLKTRNGVSIMYSGSISSMNNVLPQESLVIEGEKGTLFNESQWLEPPLWFFPKGSMEKINLTKEIKNTSTADQYNISDEYILGNFYRAITNKEEPLCAAREGLLSIVVLEASRLACETGKVIYLDHII